MHNKPSSLHLFISYAALAAIVAVPAALQQVQNNSVEEHTVGNRTAPGLALAAIEAEAGLPVYGGKTGPDEARRIVAGEDGDTGKPVERPPQEPDETTFAGLTGETGTTATSTGVDTASVPPAGHWRINIAALESRDKARELADRMRVAGFEAALRQVSVHDRQYWRVYLEGLASYPAAQDTAALIRDRLGLDGFWISRTS